MSYKILGDYIRKVDNKNKDMKVLNLQGLSMTKEFRKSTSNIVGTDLSKYKIVKQGQFCCDFMSVIRVHKLPVVLNNLGEDVIISPAYIVFEVIDKNLLLPEYLMLWFRRTEFDRYADFRCDSSIRGGFQWEELCEVELPVPSIEKQREIVAQYQAVENKIKVNEQICEKLEATAQTLYKQWFVDFEFPNEEGQPYKSSGGKMVWNEELEKEIPEGWEVKSLGEVSKIIMGQSPEGDSYNELEIGEPLINGPVEFGDYFTVKSKWTTEPKKYCKKDDFIMCVRGSTVGRYVISDGKYAIGRGVCSISSDFSFYLIYLIKENLFEILKDVTGSTFPNLDRKTLEMFRVINPCIDVKKHFEINYKYLELNIQNYIKQNQKLTQLQSLLLSRLATLEG